MDLYLELKLILNDYVDVDEENIFCTSIPSSDLNILQVRDRITGIGEIVFEDLNNQIYVIMFNTGEAARQRSFSCIKLREENIYIASYTSKKVSKSNLAKKNTELIIDKINNKPTQKRRWSFFLMIVLITIGIASILAIVSQINKDEPNNIFPPGNIVVGPTREVLIEEYENVIANYTTIAKEYNELASTLNPEYIGSLSPSVEYGSVIKDWKNSYKSIIVDTTKKEIENTEKLLTEYMTLVQICNPSDSTIIEKLEYLEGIGEISAVTPENDPNHLLNTENGYTSCVYFTIKSINQNEIPGITVIDKGTDAGGCIESYKTFEDAKARCEYLAQFDSTLLYTGSHDILGTIVIRVSYKLPNEDQIKITEMIKKSFLTISRETIS